MNYSSYIYLVPLLPLLGFVILGLWGRKHFKKLSGIMGTGLLLLSTALALYTAAHYFLGDGKQGDIYRSIIPVTFTWLRFSSSLSIDMGILLDPISVMMLVVVTFVSLMVHIFSIGYMKNEERY